MHRHIRKSTFLLTAIFVSLLCFVTSPVLATTWYVSPSGSSSNSGTQSSPWDIASALVSSSVQAGDTIYLMDGEYDYWSSGYNTEINGNLWVQLMGTASQRITVCPAPGAHPIINGGIWVGHKENYGQGDVLYPSNYTDFRDIEFRVNAWVGDVVSQDTGPWPSDIPSPFGGVGLKVGTGNRVINCVVHAASEAFTTEVEDVGSSVYGCFAYGCGWEAPDRGHGHCFYTQNRDPNKIHSMNILSVRYPDGQQTMQAYGTGGTWIDHFWLEDNIAMDGQWLLGGGATFHDAHSNRNVFYGIPVWHGYSLNQVGINGDLEATNNVAVDATMNFWWIQSLTDSNNTIIGGGGKNIYDPCTYTPHYTAGAADPNTPTVILKTNAYQSGRGHLVVFNYNHSQNQNVTVNLAGVVNPSSNFKLMNFKDFYGTPIYQGTTDSSDNVTIPAPSRFNVYVVLATTGGPINQPPTANAGNDQSITWPTNTLTLSGSKSDDGLPNPPAATTSTWSKTSGPGTVTFGSVNSVSSSATFSTTGTYVVRLTVSDSNLTAYDEATITVSGQTNVAPTANAGIDQNITWPTNSVSLAGTISDDGLPSGSTTCTWSKTSGPGTVTFGSVNAASSTATFSTTGTYVVRLTASDTALTGYDEATITVNPQSSGPNPVDWLKFDEGSGSTASDSSGNGHTGTLYNSPSWISGKYSNALSFNGSSSYCQVADFSLNSSFSVAFWFKPTANSLNSPDANYHYMFSWGAPEVQNDVDIWLVGSAESVSGLALRVSTMDNNDSDAVVLLRDPADIHFYDGNWHHLCVTIDKTHGRYVYFDGVSKFHDTTEGGDAIDPATNIFIGGRYDLNSQRFFTGGMDDVRIYNVELSSTDVTNVMNNSSGGGTNNPPTVSAGTNQTITLPAAATLSGTVSDDGLPNPPAATTCTWSKNSGPGTVTFGNPNAASTTATFSVSGTYVLTLTASDSNLTASSNVTIKANGAPTANAGVDQSITLPTNSLTLAGTISDDGIPAAATCTWSKTSGPGTVTFGNVNAANTTATFSAIGTYVVRLTVTDSLASTYDEATIIVNTAPTANAGVDQSITLPTNSVTLSGSISDDGIPAAATCTWSKTSGPGTVTFGNANAASTTATFSVAGTYVVRLTANDTLASVYDEATIIVNGAPTANAGVDQEITWPTNSVTLAGTISDDGIPAAATCTWSKTSGPGTVTFGNVNAANTTATFSTTGTYVVRLTVTDTLASTYDEATITIDPNTGGPTKTAWLKLDEGSGSSASDTTGNGHTGTLYSSPSWISGKFSNALSFNGSSSYMGISNFSLNSSFSISFWFKPTSGSLDSSQSGYHYVFSWGNIPESTNGVQVWFTTASEPNWGTAIRTFASDANGTNMNDSDCLTVMSTSYNFYDGNWHLYTLTFSGTNGRKVYLDGNMKVSDTKDVGHSITLPTGIYVGARSDLNSARFYNGGVDDLRIYNLELASTDVSNIYSGQ